MYGNEFSPPGGPSGGCTMKDASIASRLTTQLIFDLWDTTTVTTGSEFSET